MNGATVPQSVIDAARNANAAVEKVEGEKLFIIRVKNGDDACTVVNKWIESLPENVSAYSFAGWSRMAYSPGGKLDHQSLRTLQRGYICTSSFQSFLNNVILYPYLAWLDLPKTLVFLLRVDDFH